MPFKGMMRSKSSRAAELTPPASPEKYLTPVTSRETEPAAGVSSEEPTSPVERSTSRASFPKLWPTTLRAGNRPFFGSGGAQQALDPSCTLTDPASSTDILAAKDTFVASRYKLNGASIDAKFDGIEYGLFNGRPACMIVIDVRLAYNPDDIIKSVTISFTFGEDNNASTNDTHPRLSNCFYPSEIQGLADMRTERSDWSVNPQAFGFRSANKSSSTTIVKQSRWLVQGREEVCDPKGADYDTYRWKFYENASSADSLPRAIRLGMIVYHSHRAFWMDTTIEGSVRGKVKSKLFPAICQRRQFNPPTNSATRKQLLLRNDLLESHVNSQNRSIPGVDRIGGGTSTATGVPQLLAATAGGSIQCNSGSGGMAGLSSGLAGIAHLDDSHGIDSVVGGGGHGGGYVDSYTVDDVQNSNNNSSYGDTYNDGDNTIDNYGSC